MSMKWAAGLPYWAPYAAAELLYDVSHLNPFRFHLQLQAHGERPARAVEIRVGFSAHTFTIGCTEAEGPHRQYSRGAHDLRRFCPERYGLSKLLPDVIRSLPTRKCFFAKQNNFFVVEIPEAIPADSEYWVFFDVRRADEIGAVTLHVQSAYLGDKAKPPAGRRAKKVGFAVLVSKALAGQKPVPPP
jgi:hypothetical protein